MSSTLPAPKCPQCGAELRLGPFEHVDVWSCPAGHGLGLTLSEAYEQVESDEVQKIWHGSEDASPGRYACPMCAQPMVSVSVPLGAPGSPAVSLDVCREDEFIWFDPGELDELPEGKPAAPPSAEEQAKIDRIRKVFDHGLDEALDAEEREGVLNRFANHVVAHRPGFVHLLDHVVYRHELDDLDAHAA